MSWARNDTVAVIEVGWNWSRTVDKAAVAERIVAQVTVWIHPVILRRWRELGCGISSAARVVSRTRTIVVRAVDVAVVRTVDIAVVRTVVVRTVDIAVVRAVVRADSAFCADIAHVVVIVSAGIYSRRVAAALSCLTVCRTG